MLFSLTFRGKEIKNITKIEQNILFLFLFLVLFLWRFSRKNLFTQCIYNLFAFKMCLTHFFEQDHLSNLFF